ncbi:hypothetical protein F5Y11DRAFT_354108 [Daldinia sp. FL1419]|nr:hypothetical protein F5Y11DRAFT_354108 [Daldinia sp. FL1419]
MGYRKTPSLELGNGNIASNSTKNIQRPAKSCQRYRPNHSSDFAASSPRHDITGPSTRLYYPSAFDDLISPSNLTPPLSAIRSLGTPQYIPIPSRTSSVSTISQASYPTTEVKQRQSARELFEQHGIRRPPGWFSDDEDLSLLGDRTAGPRRFCRICHVCSARTWSRTRCLSCQHRLCEKCLCEVPKNTEKEHRAFSHNTSHVTRQDEARHIKPASPTPKPVQSPDRTSNNRSTLHAIPGLQLEASGNVDNEESVQPVALATANTIPERLDSPRDFLTRPERPLATRHYHCKESQLHMHSTGHEVSSTRVECDNPMCRATHAGHYPYRHSITCALHRSEELERCRGSPREFQGIQSKEVTLQPSTDTIHRRYITGNANHGTRHLHCSRVDEAANEPGHSITGQAQEFKSTETECASYINQGYRDSRDIISNYATTEDDVTGRVHTSNAAGAIKRDARSRRPLPKSRVFSPPPWLQAPSKEAGDARSRLRHIEVRNHGHRLHISVTSSEEERVDHSRSPVHGLNPERDPSTMLTENQQASLHRRCRSTHLQFDNNRYSQNMYHSPPSAHSDISHSPHDPENPKRSYSFVHEQSRIKSGHTEIAHGYRPDDTHTIRGNGHSPLSTATRASHSPLQPRQILRDINESVTFRKGGSVLEAEGRRTPNSTSGETSGFEVHHPNPIAPPNHDCSWKERYLALTAEVRLLKAELSTRNSLRGTDFNYTRQAAENIGDEDDLGIEGVTIVMHLRGRDDLVINTDLTREVGESVK